MDLPPPNKPPPVEAIDIVRRYYTEGYLTTCWSCGVKYPVIDFQCPQGHENRNFDPKFLNNLA